MRAGRDAETLRQPLFLVQAADRSVPPMPMAQAAKLMNRANPKDTGNMHGMLAVHVGMRVRLLDHIDQQHGLVKDAEGTIVEVVVDGEADQARVEDAEGNHGAQVYLSRLPKGIWVRMDKYSDAPFADILQDHDDRLTKDLTGPLVFLEPRASKAFKYHGKDNISHEVTRTGFPISHAQVITTTACQGRTMRQGGAAP